MPWEFATAGGGAANAGVKYRASLRVRRS
jgi:hypothetical protein